MNTLIDQLNASTEKLLTWATSVEVYSQIGLVVLASILVYTLTASLRKHSSLLNQPPREGSVYPFRLFVFNIKDLIFPLLLIFGLSISLDISDNYIGNSWVVRASLSLAMVFMLYSLIDRSISKKLYRKTVMWVVLPIAFLNAFGWLSYVVEYLESWAIELGNIKITAYGVARILIFGTLLFWLSRIFNATAIQLIRKQEDLDIGTREVFAKLFQVILYVVVFLLLLQIMGINLTALAVFGGALGVGLGFGLQAIASNFISGIILLLDRSLTIGDYIEMEDGRSGFISDLNMRSTTLETFDGKDIMIPNEQFITSSFTNWTHKHKKQRYALEFQVAYKTDIEQLLPIVRDVVNSHPQVIHGDDLPIAERADAEIKQFGESGIDILVEFWMYGIDDGDNHVGADLLLMIWSALREHGIEIPFPQREVTLLDKKGLQSTGHQE